jgi:shikimate kinase
MTNTRHIVLIGLMASGKTTVGVALATRLGRPFVDNDAQLQARTGHSAREIAITEGADGLHRREAEALVAALAMPTPAVVAAAAAAPLEPDVAAALRSHDVVYLRAPPAVLAARLAGVPVHDDHRPFVAADPRAVLDAQFAERDATYLALATVTVDSGGTAPESIVDEIIAALAR